MTKEEILKIAQEYDLIANNAEHGISTIGIVNFAKLIANYEREQCLKICSSVFYKPMEILIKDVSTYENGWIEGCKLCYETIDARSNNE